MSAPAAYLPESTVVAFSVHGVPVPQGSKNAIRQGSRTLIVERGRATLRPWRGMIAGEAAAVLPAPLGGPLAVRLGFRFTRPKSHYRTGQYAGELRASAPEYLSTRPDVDKLARAVLDALTGVAFLDDGQVAELTVAKVYAERAGVDVELRSLA